MTDLVRGKLHVFSLHQNPETAAWATNVPVLFLLVSFVLNVDSNVSFSKSLFFSNLVMYRRKKKRPRFQIEMLSYVLTFFRCLGDILSDVVMP